MPAPERLTLSGNTYLACDFDLLPIDADFHPVAAVYVVTGGPAGAARRARGGLCRREAEAPGALRQPWQGRVLHPARADCVGVHSQEDEASRRETVEDLVAQLKPACNA